MLDTEISALQMLLVPDVCLVWFRGELKSSLYFLFFFKKKKASARIFQPLATAAFWGSVSVRAGASAHLFFQNAQKGEGIVRRAVASRKPEKAPSSKDPFQVDTHCCLAVICILCISVRLIRVPELKLYFLCFRAPQLAWDVCSTSCCSSSAFRTIHSIFGIFSRGLGLSSVLKVLEGGWIAEWGT